MSSSEDASFDLDLLAASLRSDTSDLDAFLESLATKLEGAVPDSVTVQRGRRGLRGPKLVRKIVLEAGDQRLELSRAESAVACTSSRVSGGIVINRESLNMDRWLAAVGSALNDEAQRSQRAREALERLLLS